MSRKKYKVVIVEDEPPILENIIEKIELLDDCFLVVSSASNGLEALKEIEKMKPDVLFTDVRMPIMDGIQLIREVRNRFPGIYIVILSGYSEFSYAQQALKLNVRDYLLKPLKSDQLAETLAGIREELNRRFHAIEREIIVTDIFGNKADTPIPSSLYNSRYLAYLGCIGNLQKGITKSVKDLNFNEIWKKINWDDVLGSVLTPVPKWWLVDEQVPNRKFLLLAFDNESLFQIFDLNEGVIKIKDILSNLTHPYNITLCTNDSFIEYSEIRQTAQKLRFLIESCLIPCSSSVLTPAFLDDRKPTSIYIDTITENGIRKLIERKELSNLKKQFISLFKDWSHNKYPQTWMESALVRFVAIMQSQLASSTFDINEIEEKTLDIIAAATDISILLEDLWLILEELLMKDNLFNDSTEDIIKKVAEYIKMNLTRDLGLEEIARKFNFNPSYLIRIFKQYRGETPMQYLISLRIEEAKRLMLKNPFLELKDICEIVGYPDQHYFSRVFKNVTGLSPSDYKDSFINQNK